MLRPCPKDADCHLMSEFHVEGRVESLREILLSTPRPSPLISPPTPSWLGEGGSREARSPGQRTALPFFHPARGLAGSVASRPFHPLRKVCPRNC
jgi:hypothetical protein